MAITTQQISGDVVLPNGVGAAGGRIILKLSQPGSTDDSGVEQLVGGKKEIIIGADGAVDFNVVPNDEILPLGTYYKAEFILPDGTSFIQYWDVVVAGGAVDIGAVPKKTGLGLVDPWPTGAYPVTELPTAQASRSGKVYYLTEDDGTYAAGFYACMEDPGTPGSYDWVVITGWPV